MSTNEELERTVAWLETWVDEHPSSRAAGRVTQLLAAFKAMNGENLPAEEGVPVGETAAKYVHIKNEMLSRIPQGSLWAAQYNDEMKVENFILHLYHTHTLGCVECFGGDRH
jgi:hypothetical protein